MASNSDIPLYSLGNSGESKLAGPDCGRGNGCGRARSQGKLSVGSRVRQQNRGACSSVLRQVRHVGCADRWCQGGHGPRVIGCIGGRDSSGTSSAGLIRFVPIECHGGNTGIVLAMANSFSRVVRGDTEFEQSLVVPRGVDRVIVNGGRSDFPGPEEP